MNDFADAYASMDLRELAADAIRERDQLRSSLAASDLDRIRLRDGLREALAELDDLNDLTETMCADIEKMARTAAEDMPDAIAEAKAIRVKAAEWRKLLGGEP